MTTVAANEFHDCQSSGYNCVCQVDPIVAEQLSLPVESQIFSDIRSRLEVGRSGNNHYPFYIYLVDGYRGEGISVGENPHTSLNLRSAADSFQQIIEVLAQSLVAKGSNVDVLNVIAGLGSASTRGDVEFAKRMKLNAQAYTTLYGQPLTDAPSRLEQCLVIELARHLGAMKDVSATLQPPGSLFYVVEDYLGFCPAIEEAYAEACRTLEFQYTMPKSELAPTRSAISNVKTAPFLVAEHLQFIDEFRSRATLQQLIDFFDDPEQRPGIAFFPIKILGQYRAAAAWLFTGRFDSNSQLFAHLNEIGRYRDFVLESSLSERMLHSANVRLLTALNNFEDPKRTRFVQCMEAHRAFSRLWLSKSLAFSLKNSKGSADRGGSRYQNPRTDQFASRFKLTPVDLRCTTSTEVANIIGFDTVHFECPLTVTGEEFDAQKRRVQDMFDYIGASALAGYQRSQLRQQIDIDLTAHEYQNSLNDLNSILNYGGESAEDLPPESRLNLTAQRIRHWRGYAWATRAITKAQVLGRSLDTALSGSEQLQFQDEGPSPDDIGNWQKFLFWEAMYAAISARLRHCDNRGRIIGQMALEYNFETDPKDADYSFGQRVSVSLAAFEKIRAQLKYQRPQWPLRPASSELATLGRQAILLWGATELMRNAANATANAAKLDRREETMCVRSQIIRQQSSWSIWVVVENPADIPPPLSEKFSLMQRLIPELRFEHNSHFGGIARFTYILEHSYERK